MTMTTTHVGQCASCKPAKRPRFNGADFTEALVAGHRYALGHGEPAIVYPSAYGWGITYSAKTLPFGHPYYTVAVDGAVTATKLEVA